MVIVGHLSYGEHVWSWEHLLVDNAIINIASCLRWAYCGMWMRSNLFIK